MFGRFSNRYANSKAMSFAPATVTKTVPFTCALLETEITRRAGEVGRATGLFGVPKILSSDLSAGWIEFERLNGLVMLGQFLADDTDGLSLLNRAGRAISAVHKNMALPEGLRLPASENLQSSHADTVAIHGDFNTMNVAYMPDKDRIVLLDWASASAFGKRVTIGSRYIDLAQFLRSLMVHQASHFRAYRLFNERREAFLDGYQQEAGRPVDLHCLRRFLLRISTIHMRHQFRWPPRREMFTQTPICLAGHVALRRVASKWTDETAGCGDCEREVGRCA